MIPISRCPSDYWEKNDQKFSCRYIHWFCDSQVQHIVEDWRGHVTDALRGKKGGNSPLDIMLRLPSKALNSTAWSLAMIPDASRFCTANTWFDVSWCRMVQLHKTYMLCLAGRAPVWGSKITINMLNFDQLYGTTYHGRHNWR